MTYYTDRQRDLIEDLNAQLDEGLYTSAYDCAIGNNLVLVEWIDQAGGLFRAAGGALVFGREYPASSFDDRVEVSK